MFHTNTDGGHSPPSVKSIYPHETLRTHQDPSLRFSPVMNYLVDCKACPNHLPKQKPPQRRLSPLWWPDSQDGLARGANHHNIRRFSAKSRFSLNVVMVFTAKQNPPQRCPPPCGGSDVCPDKTCHGSAASRFQVPQVAPKEERRVLWYASDGLRGEMGCLGPAQRQA